MQGFSREVRVFAFVTTQFHSGSTRSDLPCPSHASFMSLARAIRRSLTRS